MAGEYNFELRRGDTFRRVITIKANNAPIDLTGYTAKMQIRTHDLAETLLQELTTENGGLIIGDGTVMIYLSASITGSFSFINAKYDLELRNGTFVKTHLEGIITLVRDVTRDE